MSSGRTEELLAANRALRESEERFRSLTALSSDWYWEQDENLRFTYLSNQAQALTGYSAESSLGKTRWEIANMTPLSCSWPEHQAVLAAREPFRDLECRRVGPDGTVRYLSMSGEPLFDQQGRFKGYHGIGRNITDRKLAEQALRESQERYALAVAGSDAGVWDYDFVARRHFSSARARELAGLPPEPQTLSMHEGFAVLPLHPEDVPRRIAAMQAHLAGETPMYEGEFRVRQPDGSYRWRRMQGLCVRDADGKPLRLAGSISDVDARKRAEAALRLSEERYALAMEVSEEGHFDWNVRTDEIFASAHLEKLLDLPADFEYRTRGDMVSRIAFYPGDRELISQMTRDVLAGSALQNEFEYRLLRGEAREPRWIHGRWKIFRDAAGVAQRVIGVISDMTERKRAEAELRESEARFRGLTELWSDWYWRQDESLRFTYSSAAISPPDGYPGGSAIGKTRWELPGIVPLSSSWAEHQALLAACKPFRDFEYSRPADDGTMRYIATSGAPILDDQGRFRGYHGVGRNITERKRIEEELRLAQRLEAMGTLAGGIAHDFNNILGAILGFSEMAWRDAPKGSRLQRDLESIATAGERGRALVERILAFSRSGVGERVAVHVEKVVREALDLLSAKLPPNVTLSAELRAGRAAVLGDPTQVHQVLMNLGTNAVQAMASGGMLRVSLDAVRCEAARAANVGKVVPGDYIVLQVVDSGSGIAAEILERIFDPFFTTKELGTGTGLGLSLVHGIVAELGGAVDVESAPGKGTAFTVHLPRSGDALDSSEMEQSDLPRGDGQRVLVVDDEEPLVRLATRTLEELGYRPVGFTSSAAALAAFCAEPGRFDALIADERMPGLSGTALIREVRGVRRAIPILLMSGYVGGAVASLAREAGANDVLKKPLLARDLATSLARVLQQ